MSKQPTCAERVAAACESRMTEIRDLYDVYCGRTDPHDDVTEDSFPDYGLAFDYVSPGTFMDQEEGYWRFQISWGGPSEEIRFYASPRGSKSSGFGDWRLHRAEFWFLDWGDGACEVLTGDHRNMAVELFEHFDECGSVTAQLEAAERE